MMPILLKSFRLAILCSPLSVLAQATGLLYDPQPPADSAYVRVLHATPGQTVDVVIDGKPRLRNIAAGTASDYLVLSAGSHTLSLLAPGRDKPLLTTPLDINPGRATSLAFPTLKADAKPLIFQDKANANKAKAVICAYNLLVDAEPVDIVTVDGATKVFSGLASGTSSCLAVNPINVDLILTSSGKTARKTSLSMTHGGTYSLIVHGDAKKQPVLQSQLNQIERYTGK